MKIHLMWIIGVDKGDKLIASLYQLASLQIHSVENFVCSVNSHLTTRQENERLKGIMARIDSYEVVVSVD